MEKWLIKKNKSNKTNLNLNLNPIVEKILLNRGIDTEKKVEEFLNPSYENLNTPLLMKDLIRAGNIILNHISKKNKIAISGDYDVDGVMSTTILLEGLKELGGNVIYKIPNRYNDGYGINNRIVDECFDEEVKLIITCDNGIAAKEAVDYANSKDIQVIVTDHHEIPLDENSNEILPNAEAVVDPKQKNCTYPFRDLCGAGVVFKLISYLYKLKGINWERERYLLQFVAMATVCDVMPIVEENRIFVKYGLQALNSSDNLGMKELIRACQIKDPIDVYHLGFILGPSINSAGRLADASKAVELFTCNDFEKAKEISKELRELNVKRQELTDDGFKELDNFILNHEMDKKFPILVLLSEDLNESVAGIVAGRLKEKYKRPVIVLSGKETLKGSGRSIEEYNMFEKISHEKYLLEKFGGHKMAAGMSLERENLVEFIKNLNNNSDLKKEDFFSKYYIDAQAKIKDLNMDLAESINALKPFGNGNEAPVLGFKSVIIDKIKILGKNQNVLKLSLRQDENNIDAIYFSDFKSFKEKLKEGYAPSILDELLLGKRKIFVDLIGSLDINEFNGNKYLQVKIKSIRAGRKQC
ncbi:single-stranded-DNA-specific exonuclease [Peptoniphilus koenoeneniae]|uniref:Single-stranded-DNA-specific exonuclease RecJ n=1 Tax=Peptoniphilus koenoeneniae TaxID=507751 RepID=A0ABU0AW82_9FIRM|nr:MULTISPECIES: single-stranded-DNA-specific exonuclease RecJ [Peptoniphilus]ERT56837.1 single-stranded-DNA-specific exonuclease RecJ [Peptoniphilus sp. BV3C26]MDQ0274250.1 single-stranded-DNA-specific exonuclease [Peptoniphilus koenoeneniae]